MNHSEKWLLFFGFLMLLYFSFPIGAEKIIQISSSRAKNTVIEFYQAVKEHRCEDAIKLRPDYSKEACLNTTDVELVSANPVDVDSLLEGTGLTHPIPHNF